ncbi:MAG: CYTH domain-containing protein [Lentisphaeria bacterium]|nr:CYTH domain-containing protein [Lentisphaeria bacterium]
MSLEVEKKYRISNLPDEIYKVAGIEIRQGYLNPGKMGNEVRIRSKGSNYYLTVKGQGDIVREEVELEISKEHFNELWPMTEGARIEKIRYPIPWGDLTFEVDLFKGKLKGLQVVEVEFTDQLQASSFHQPDFFGEDLTTDERYKNANLALNGIPS